MNQWITINKENIENEHICCAFSDKKCQEGYALKKEWLKTAFDNGYVFRRLNERAKVFIEYGPAEKAWTPVDASNYFLIHCFWVAGQYKGNGNGKVLLEQTIEDAKRQGKSGLAVVAGSKKMLFMGDTKWYLRQGFEICDKTESGFILLVKKFESDAQNSTFKDCCKNGVCENSDGITVYYSNRCPYTEYYVNNELRKTAQNHNIPITIHHLQSIEQAQSSPSPATNFSLFYNGKFVTTDLSICLESKFVKLIK